MLNFKCPLCGSEMEVAECYRGEMITCCGCQKEIQVPKIIPPKPLVPSPPPAMQLNAKPAAAEYKFALEGVYSYTCPLCGSVKSSDAPLKKFSTYVILSWLLGAYGAGDFYIGDNKKGCIKLGITIVCCLVLGPLISQIWSMIDLCKTRHDINGNPLI